MSKSSLLTSAVLLAAFGVAILTGHPPWGLVTGVSILLTAAAMAAGALLSKGSAEELTAAGKPSTQKIPASLVTLSASAILAVYAAGYQRTRTAAEKFDVPVARHPAAPPVATIIELPKSTLPAPPAPAPKPASPARLASAPVPPATSAPNPAPNSPTASTQPDAAPAASVPPAPAPATPTPAPAPAVPSAAPTQVAAASKPATPLKDGTFTGWGDCRHGSIQASVSVQNGQIVDAKITECRTRYSCSWIAVLPGQVVTRQSAEVDYVSGATESTDAFYQAVASALASARE